MILIAKITAINTTDNYYNLAVNDNNQAYNLKAKADMIDGLKIGHIYEFEYERFEGERVSNVIKSYKRVIDLDMNRKDEILRSFLPSALLSYDEMKKTILEYIEKIDNKIIKDITKSLVYENIDNYFIYPAASKMHHAYVGGLAYHCSGMLKLADGFLAAYPFLDKSILYAGIILHDIGKLIELSGVEATEYSLEGQLLGHLVMGAMIIENKAISLGYKDAKEVLILKHLLVSHHGNPQFGSAKRPMTAEALALWYIDTVDSKFRVLEEELAKTESGSFTDSIGVIDRQKFYKF